MQQLMELIEINIVYIALALLGFAFITTMLVIILLIKHGKLKKAYNNFMRGSEVNIEALLKECINRTDNVEKEHKLIKENVVEIQRQLAHCTQKVGVVRYNAIQGVGADLSFAVALLDDKDNGIVINGIYTRDGSYTYAKPVIKGTSKYTLSDEEMEAIKKASQDKV